MADFRKIQLTDREWINTQLKKSQFMTCDYSFGNNFIWSESYGIRFADINGFYCLRSDKLYMYPAGEGDIAPVIEQLMADAKLLGRKFVLCAVRKDDVERLEALFPDMFEFSSNRADSEYVYLAEKLATLSGKKLHGKRNHISRFKEKYDWEYEPITTANMDECIEMSRLWCESYNKDMMHEMLQEQCAVSRAFENFDALGFEGGLIRANGRVVAFSIGEPLTDNTYVVHIEKAFSDIQGAFPIINQQFVQHNCQSYTYVNREEDMGDEGLRKAKLSYYPELLIDKYIAVLKEEL